MVTIRLVTPGDAAECREIYAPYVRDTTVSFELSPPSDEEFEQRLAKKRGSYPWLVCEHDGDVVGFSYASQHRGRGAYQWDVESSVYVDDQHHRAGVASGLYRSLFAVLRLQGYYNVYAGTTLPNPASVQFHRAMGFEPVGVYHDAGYKHGEWRDVQWWQRSLQPHEDDPDPPTPVQELDEVALRDAVAAGLDDVEL